MERVYLKIHRLAWRLTGGCDVAYTTRCDVAYTFPLLKVSV